MSKKFIEQNMFDLVDSTTCYREKILDFCFVDGMDRDTIEDACHRKGCCVLCDIAHKDHTHR